MPATAQLLQSFLGIDLRNDGVSFKNTASGPSADFHDYVVRKPSTPEILRGCSTQISEEQSWCAGSCMCPYTMCLENRWPRCDSVSNEIFLWAFPSPVLTSVYPGCLLHDSSEHATFAESCEVI